MKLKIVTILDEVERIIELLNIRNKKVKLSKKQKSDIKAIFSEFVGKMIEFPNNSDMSAYLMNNALDDEWHHKSRSFFIKNDDEIVGFFTLSMKISDLSQLTKKEKKEILIRGKSPNSVDKIPTILLAQFGKNSLASTAISGSLLLTYVIDFILEAREYVGAKAIIIDSINQPKVIKFNKENKFIPFGEIITDKLGQTYQQMYLDLEDYPNQL